MKHATSSNGISSFPGEGDIRFSLNGTIYQNNSIVTLEDIGEGNEALVCLTDQTVCCRYPSIGNWFFPNRTRVPSAGTRWEMFRTRGQMKVLMHRRKGGITGVYRCVIPDALNATQTIYIGIYTATCEWYMHTPVVHNYNSLVPRPCPAFHCLQYICTWGESGNKATTVACEETELCPYSNYMQTLSTKTFIILDASVWYFQCSPMQHDALSIYIFGWLLVCCA